jgi:tetratricopeptide (TPR) repeat protein
MREVSGACRACAVIAFVASLLAVQPAWAQAEDPRYTALLADAVAEYGAGNYAEARALFAQAHAVLPNARTLRGMGMAAFELREYADALRHLRAALASKDRPLTADQRAHAEGLLRRAHAYVGSFVVALQPADASLLVDGVPAVLEPDGTLLLSLGRHELTARCPTCQDLSRTVVVRGGETGTLTLQLEPRVSEATAPAVARDAAEPSHRAASDRSGARWLLGGAGVAAASAVATGLWWANRRQELTVCEAPNVCANEDALERQRRAALGMTVGLGLGAVALAATGTALMLSARRGRSERAWACAPGILGGACEVHF